MWEIVVVVVVVWKVVNFVYLGKFMVNGFVFVDVLDYNFKVFGKVFWKLVFVYVDKWWMYILMFKSYWYGDVLVVLMSQVSNVNVIVS